MRLFFALACLPLFVPRATAALGGDTAPPRYEVHLAEDAALELRAFWEPCADSRFGVFDSTPALHTPVPAHATARYGASDFRPFLPSGPVEVGAVWKVDDEAVLTFLRQFHPGAMLKGKERGEVPGTYACLRAVSDEAFEILLRAHAVFDFGAVFFKPAQYEGRLVLDRASGALRAFDLALPSRNPNADAHRRSTATRPPKADLGWIPRMELTSGDRPALTWTQEISDEEARTALRRSFYEWAAVDWVPFEQAVLRARELHKPLHLLVVLGALDDDSC